MKKFVKLFLCVLLSVSLALGASGCVGWAIPFFVAQSAPATSPTASPIAAVDTSAVTPEPLSASPHADTSFSTMRYERPDTEAIKRAIEALTKRIEQKVPSDKLLAEYESIKQLYDEADGQASLAYLLYAFDVTDTYYEEEYASLQSALSALDLSMTDVTIALSESSDEARALLTNAYGEGYLDTVYAGESLNSDEVQPLNDAEQALVTEYDRLSASFVLTDGGKEWSLNDILADDSLNTREFYRLYDAYCTAFNEKAGDLFLRLLKIRSEIAETLGYGSYAAYQYDCYGRDYTIADAKALHAAVKKYIVPVYVAANTGGATETAALSEPNDLLSRLARELASFWEVVLNKPDQATEDITSVYQLSLATYDSDSFLSAFGTAVQDFSPSLYEPFAYMLKNNLYDFSVSPKKMSGSFTTYLSNYHAPFIFTQWNNDAISVDTMLHEFGHFTNYYHNPLVGWSQSDSLDLAEVDSQALQLLMTPYYPELYGAEYADAAVDSLLLDSMYAIISGCMEDEFQQLVYSDPDLTLADMNALYLRLAGEYGLSDLYGYTGTEWTLITHTFQTPLYYISYATSMIPALELWQLSLSDTAHARTAYLKIVDRAPYAAFRDTLAENGLPDVFDKSTCAAIAALLDEQT